MNRIINLQKLEKERPIMRQLKLHMYIFGYPHFFGTLEKASRLNQIFLFWLVLEIWTQNDSDRSFQDLQK